MEVAGLLQFVQHIQHRLPARALLGQLGNAQVGADILQGLCQIPAAVPGQSIGLLQQCRRAFSLLRALACSCSQVLAGLRGPGCVPSCSCAAMRCMAGSLCCLILADVQIDRSRATMLLSM